MPGPESPRRFSRRQLLVGLGATAALPILAACEPDKESVSEEKIVEILRTPIIANATATKKILEVGQATKQLSVTSLVREQPIPELTEVAKNKVVEAQTTSNPELPASDSVEPTPSSTLENKEEKPQVLWSREMLPPKREEWSYPYPAFLITDKGASPQPRFYFTNPNGDIESIDIEGKTISRYKNPDQKVLHRVGYEGDQPMFYASQPGKQIRVRAISI
ncbi:hypothetical protein CMO96_04630 [Candidatus Woesebacteria bacterium]|nr:hypothetical protein [Candidatus Woesebacteria bacterium]|tara:strand:- start:850 stop:1509 length:660 start_codon:yes stop_codon:yes gene_type:complete